MTSPAAYTYWLKYLLLKYIHQNTDESGGILTLNDLLRAFKGTYPENLIRLVLGSLASTEVSACIEVVEAASAQVVKITCKRRGRALYSRRNETEAEWCLSWDYIQLVIDDYQMAYPSAFWDKIFPKIAGLGYLLRPSGIYTAELALDVAAKAKGCAHLLQILHFAKDAELKNRIKNNSLVANLFPDMKVVKASFVQAMTALGPHVKGVDELLPALHLLLERLNSDPVLEELFQNYGCDEQFVMDKP